MRAADDGICRAGRNRGAYWASARRRDMETDAAAVDRIRYDLARLGPATEGRIGGGRTGMPRTEQQTSSVNAVIYARVSSKEQDLEGFSNPAQLELLRKYAQEHGIFVLQEFVDVESASVTGRSGFGRCYHSSNGTGRSAIASSLKRLIASTAI
jgi:hypothetical protein